MNIARKIIRNEFYIVIEIEEYMEDYKQEIEEQYIINILMDIEKEKIKKVEIYNKCMIEEEMENLKNEGKGDIK